MNKKVRTLLIVVAALVVGWALLAGHEENRINNLKAEVASLKAEITATRTAIDLATIFAYDHDGVIAIYAAPTPDMSSPRFKDHSNWDLPIPAIAIRVEARHHDYPTKEYVVGKGGYSNEITYNDDGSVISSHAGNWGDMLAWRR